MEHHTYQLEYEGEQIARDPHLDLFCNVFTQYIGDLKAHQRWLVWPDASESEDGGAAWRDFRSPKRPQFNHLCDMTGIDSDAAHEAIKATLVALCRGGYAMTPHFKFALAVATLVVLYVVLKGMAP